MSDLSLDLWFDPGCPWCYITSRWVTEVTAVRGVQVRWRSFSLTLKNEGGEGPPRLADPMRRVLRVAEALRSSEGEHAVATWYTETGRRIHIAKDRPSGDLTPILEAAGLPTGCAASADDETLDATIRSSMEEALSFVGDDVGVPILVFDDGTTRQGFFGPVLSPAPTGDEALALWDSVATFATAPGFWELKRTRTVGPQMPAQA